MLKKEHFSLFHALLKLVVIDVKGTHHVFLVSLSASSSSLGVEEPKILRVRLKSLCSLSLT